MENTLWANTVLAAGSAVGIVVYTGRETRSVMNNSMPRSKVGLIDLEINNLTKVSIKNKPILFIILLRCLPYLCQFVFFYPDSFCGGACIRILNDLLKRIRRSMVLVPLQICSPVFIYDSYQVGTNNESAFDRVNKI